ncbi:MAG: hypothetical protein H6538_08570 [Bacteroidales bacterium]|nr:hypothetical protein [Bacteroidales bacterium]MCB9013840.1 hypothetical protein [Bacteroidales bacterium]
MKKLFSIIPGLLLLLFIPLNAQSLKSVLKGNYEATGQKNILDAEAIIINGTISQMGMEMPFIITQKSPDKVRFESSFQNMEIVQAFNGEKGWSINPMVGPDPIEMGKSEVKNLKAMSEKEGRLYNWKKKKYKLSFEGTEEGDSVPLYKVKVITPLGDEETYFINSKTNLVYKVDAKTTVQGNQIEATRYLSDYHDINGFMVPFTMETEMMGQSMGTLNFTSYEIKKASDIQDSIFEMPAPKPKE